MLYRIKDIRMLFMTQNGEDNEQSGDWFQICLKNHAIGKTHFATVLLKTLHWFFI